MCVSGLKRLGQSSYTVAVLCVWRELLKAVSAGFPGFDPVLFSVVRLFSRSPDLFTL